MTDLNSRMRALSQAANRGELSKQLGIGKYTLTGWLGGVDENGKPEPRVRMGTSEVRAKGLGHAQQVYMRQFKNRLPPEALDLNTGLVIIRTASTEDPRTFPADTPVSQGVVKFWKDSDGTGFITANGHDYFVHHSELLCDEEVFPSLQNGQAVRFIPSERKGQAIACSVVADEG